MSGIYRALGSKSSVLQKGYMKNGIEQYLEQYLNLFFQQKEVLNIGF